MPVLRKNFLLVTEYPKTNKFVQFFNRFQSDCTLDIATSCKTALEKISKDKPSIVFIEGRRFFVKMFHTSSIRLFYQFHKSLLYPDSYFIVIEEDPVYRKSQAQVKLAQVIQYAILFVNGQITKLEPDRRIPYELF